MARGTVKMLYVTDSCENQRQIVVRTASMGLSSAMNNPYIVMYEKRAEMG